MNPRTPAHTPYSLCSPERIAGVDCAVICCQSESFCGTPDFHYLAFPLDREAIPAYAVAEKVVPIGADPRTIEWETNPEVVEC